MEPSYFDNKKFKMCFVVTKPMLPALGRQLPPSSGHITQKSISKKPSSINYSGTTTLSLSSSFAMVSNMENVNPQVTRYVAKELRSLHSSPLEGVAVVMNEKDLTQVEAVIEGPADTPYAGGRFRVRLHIGKDFPAAPPKGFFVTKIFHPNVSARGRSASTP